MKVLVNDVQVEGEEVTANVSMIVIDKNNSFGERIVFDEWEEEKECFRNFGYSTKESLRAYRNEDNGNLKCECGAAHAEYKKVQ